MNIITWATHALRTKGPVQTAKIITNYGADWLFDWRYGTDTMRWIPRDDLVVTSENISHSQQYKATKARPFLQLLKQLDLPRDCTFVDIGAGKGRVVMMAAQYGFRKVVGIEFSGPLCAIARQNFASYAAKRKNLSPMEVVEADATTHQFTPDDRVFFMFNPFHQPVMEKVMQNLKNSLQTHPRTAWLIYNDPLYHSVIQAAGVFQRDREVWVGGTEFRVYQTT